MYWFAWIKYITYIQAFAVLHGILNNILHTFIQGAAEWTPIFQRAIKNERNKLQKKALYFRKVLTI